MSDFESVSPGVYGGDGLTVYLNNAATTWPKPSEVVMAVQAALLSPPAEPGRGVRVGDPVRSCREALASLFGVADPDRVCLLPSATYGLNLAIRGLLEVHAGSHAVATLLDHNSVLRPLHHLARDRALSLTLVPPDSHGRIRPGAVLEALRPETRLVVMPHASNVTGAVQPVEEIAAALAPQGVALLIDAAQSAGVIPIHLDAQPGRVFVALAGHKGLYGPTGTGALLLPDAELPPLWVGGTGVRSQSLYHPEELPLRLEAGTPNLPGLAGLRAGVAFVKQETVEHLGAHRHRCVQRLREALAHRPSLRLLPWPDEDGRAGVLSLCWDRASPAELAHLLFEGFDIETRSGLHCAPLAHPALGTHPQGTLRVSVSSETRDADLDAFVEAFDRLERTWSMSSKST